MCRSSLFENGSQTVVKEQAEKRSHTRKVQSYQQLWASLSRMGQKRRSLSLYPAELRAHIASKREAIIADFCCLVKRKLPGSSLFSGLAAKPGACGTNAGLFVTRYKSEPDLRLSTCRRPCRPVLRQPPLRRQPGDRACRRPEIRSSGRTKRWTLRSPKRFS